MKHGTFSTFFKRFTVVVVGAGTRPNTETAAAARRRATALFPASRFPRTRVRVDVVLAADEAEARQLCVSSLLPPRGNRRRRRIDAFLVMDQAAPVPAAAPAAVTCTGCGAELPAGVCVQLCAYCN